MLFGLLMQPFSFGSQNDGARGRPLHFVVIFGAAFVDAVNPIAALFEIFESSIDVGDARDRQVFERARGRFGDGFREANGTAFRDDDGIRSGGVSGAHDGAKIVRIFHAIQHHDQAGIGGHFLELGVLRRGA